MQIKLRRASLARAKRQESTAARLIANIFQGTDLVHRRRDSRTRGPASYPANLGTDLFRSLRPSQRSSRQTIHIGHALGSGFVQSIFSSPPRRSPFKCSQSVSRRDADLKILCIMPSSALWSIATQTPMQRATLSRAARPGSPSPDQLRRKTETHCANRMRRSIFNSFSVIR